MDPEFTDPSLIAGWRQHNAGLPIHTLPAELFIDILDLCTDDLDEHEYPTARLHVLAQVCSHWFHSILTNPRFWRSIIYGERHLIPTILHRNPSGPLIIDCQGVLPAESMNNFLNNVCDDASRWETLILGYGFNGTTMDILQRPMPTLKAISFYTERPEGNGLVFPVSEAPALEFVRTTTIAMPWSSPSLYGLRFLSIRCMRNFPSLHQLVAILIASPALEWFELKELIADETEEDDSGLPDRILLPALEGLILTDKMPHSMRRYLASSIVAPKCHTLQILIEFDTIERPGSTFSELVRIPMQAANFYIAVRFEDDGVTVFLVSDPGAFDTGRPTFKSFVRDNEIEIHMGYDLNKWAQLVRALALPVTTSKITLMGYTSPKDPQGRSLTKPEHFSFWTSATHIELGSNYSDVAMVLGFLRRPFVVDGEERWVCPKLKDIECYEGEEAALDADAIGGMLTEILERRFLASSEMEHGGAERDDNRPVPVKRLQAPPSILHVVRASPYAESLELVPGR